MIYKLIKEIRTQRGMTQACLAFHVGTSIAYISNLEAGKIDPRWSTLERIFSALDTPIFADGYLFNLITLTYEKKKNDSRNAS